MEEVTFLQMQHTGKYALFFVEAVFTFIQWGKCVSTIA